MEVLLGFNLGGELRAEFDFGFVGNQDVAQLAADGGAAGREGADGDEQSEESALEHGRWVPCRWVQVKPQTASARYFLFFCAKLDHSFLRREIDFVEYCAIACCQGLDDDRGDIFRQDVVVRGWAGPEI